MYGNSCEWVEGIFRDDNNRKLKNVGEREVFMAIVFIEGL
jgi:hypothetical protein